MGEISAKQIVKLIEWQRSQGYTEAQIVECLEYIDK